MDVTKGSSFWHNETICYLLSKQKLIHNAQLFHVHIWRQIMHTQPPNHSKRYNQGKIVCTPGTLQSGTRCVKIHMEPLGAFQGTLGWHFIYCLYCLITVARKITHAVFCHDCTMSNTIRNGDDYIYANGVWQHILYSATLLYGRQNNYKFARNFWKILMGRGFWQFEFDIMVITQKWHYRFQCTLLFQTVLCQIYYWYVSQWLCTTDIYILNSKV